MTQDFNGDMLSRILRRENPERGAGRHHGGMPPPMHSMQRGPPGPPPPNPLMNMNRLNDDPMRRYMPDDRAPIGDTVFVANVSTIN